MWNQKSINETKTNIQIKRTDQWLPEGKVVGEVSDTAGGGHLFGDGWFQTCSITSQYVQMSNYNAETYTLTTAETRETTTET